MRLSSSSAGRRLLRSAAARSAALLAVVLAAAFWAPRPAEFSPYGHNLDEFVTPGEVILHDVASDPLVESGRMPLASLPAALLSDHLGRRAWPVWRALAAAAALALTVACAAAAGAGLDAALAGALAWLALAARAPGHFWFGTFDYSQSMLTLLVLAVAGAGALWAERETQAGAWALAAAMGACLLYRSTLFLLPPLLAASRRRRPRRALILLLAPYAFLLPWVLMNWRISGRFILFENGPANPLVALAALGRPLRTERALRGLASLPFDVGSAGGGAVLRWAMEQVLRHPLRYAAGVLARARYFCSLEPALLVLGAAGAWLGRRRPGVRWLALLAAYLAAVHCLLAVKAEYFEPVWPLLGALSAAAFGAALPEAAAPFRARVRAAAGRALTGAVAVCLLLSAAVEGEVLAHAALAGRVPLDAALAAHPGDPWLLAERGRMRLRLGDDAGAVRDLSASLAARPGHPGREALLAWAQGLAGGGAAFSAWRAGLAPGALGWDARLMSASALAALGRLREASGEIRRAAQLAGDPAFSGRAADRIVGWSRYWLAGRPADDESFLRACCAADPGGAAFVLERAVNARAAGRPRLAQRLLRQALALQPAGAAPSAQTAKLQALLADDRRSARRALVAAALRTGALGSGRAGGRGALAMLRRFESDFAGRSDYWLTRGELEARLGRRAAAQVCAQRASQLALNGPARARLSRLFRRVGRLALGHPGADASDALSRRRLGAVALRLGRTAEALRLLGGTCGRVPRPARCWEDYARAQAAQGRRAQAAASLERAWSSAADAPERRQAALLEQDLGRNARALEMLSQLSRAAPDDPALLADLGLSEYLNGQADEAVSDLKRAIVLDPAFLPPYLTLASIRAGQRRREEAALLYERALAAAASSDPLRSAAADALAELKKGSARP